MKRRHRLSGRRSFAATMQTRAHNAPGGIRVHATTNALPHARVGMAVRGTRNAVERNRARRRLRAAVTPHLGHLAGWDVVVIAPARVDVQPWSELVRAVGQCLGRVTAP